MPRKSSLVPVYRLHKASGQAVSSIRGRIQYLGKWESPESRTAYARLLAELSAVPAAALPQGKPPSDFTVNELVADYLDFAQGYYTRNGNPSLWLGHIHLILRRMCSLYGDEPCAEFGPIRFKAVRQTLITEGHSRKYINKMIGILPRVFKWGASEELIPAEIFANLKTVETLHKGRLFSPRDQTR